MQQYSDILVLDEDGNILILQRRQDDDFMPLKWCLPGGKIEEDEDKYEAAVRELEEETCIVIDSFTYQDFCERYVNEDKSVTYYFATEYIDKYPIIILDTVEHTDFEWISIDDLDKYDFLFDLQTRIKELYTKLQVSTIKKSNQRNDTIELTENQLDKALDDEILNIDEYIFYKGKFEDASHGGKLIKVSKTDKVGKKITKWVKNSQNEKTEDFSDLSEDDLHKHAQKASEQSLNETIKNHTDPKFREVAHKELDRRKKEEYIKDDKDDENSVENLKKQYKLAIESDDFDKLEEIAKKLKETKNKNNK